MNLIIKEFVPTKELSTSKNAIKSREKREKLYGKKRYAVYNEENKLINNCNGFGFLTEEKAINFCKLVNCSKVEEKKIDVKPSHIDVIANILGIKVWKKHSMERIYFPPMEISSGWSPIQELNPKAYIHMVDGKPKVVVDTRGLYPTRSIVECKKISIDISEQIQKIVFEKIKYGNIPFRIEVQEILPKEEIINLGSELNQKIISEIMNSSISLKN